MQRRAAITGVAACSSLGQTDAFLDALLAGHSGIRPITSFDVSERRAKQAAELIDFTPGAFIPPMKLRRMDEVGALAVASARLALDAAGLPRSDAGYDDVGVVFGTCTCGVHSTGEFLDRLLELGPTGAPALLFSNTVGNAAASLVALEEKLRGPNTTLSYKEASGLAAVALASDLIRAGKAGALVTGGAEDIYDLYFQVHDWFGVLSVTGAYPEGARPFDATRNGFVMGEGGFVLVVEDLARAEARQAAVLGEVLGVGANAGVTAVNAWPTDSGPLVRCMRMALDEAGVRPDEVGAVYAAANGAIDFDRLEAGAIAEVFGGRPVATTSVKGAVGEGGMAAAASLVAAVMAGRRGLVAPTAGLANPDPSLAPLGWVMGAAAPLASPYVLVNSFASGGTNYSLVIKVH
ncbi:3-oxoacyl-[acyl-carrier-protein] synthase 2 [Luteitalea sp. TBR-22]|uniref:beta-ketoacyl-[acyl-carrier-protein] synthase family protein n=1 Tax=Luteitalea sp. TBR-22 TaxID=2802971 RepID=UPI001AF8AB42|nr:beta-ketoacyl synthase N-terminal-like domain-containing protein [Luteitalea sp. TBR-22]BCS35292.1 3-oxoacyl-[acyl-carrier-protein] synthase 2 [Luteitalea sp. TBR-22]